MHAARRALLEQALAQLTAPVGPRARLLRALSHAADPRERLLRALSHVTEVSDFDHDAAPRKEVPRRFRATTERGRLAGARLRERDEEVVRNIEAWRPDLVAAWPKLRVAAYQRAREMRARAPDWRISAAHGAFEAFQQIVHENEEAILASLQDHAERDAEEMILRHLEAEARAAKEQARARGEEAPSEDFRVDRAAAGLGRRPKRWKGWEDEAAPASVAA